MCMFSSVDTFNEFFKAVAPIYIPTLQADALPSEPPGKPTQWVKPHQICKHL